MTVPVTPRSLLGATMPPTEELAEQAFDLTAGLLTTSMLPLAAAHALWLRLRVPLLPEPAGPSAGHGPGVGTPLRVVFVGDSSVVGVGVSHTEEAIGAAFSRAWHARTGQPVHWRLHGEYGATTREVLERVVPEISGEPADLVVLGVGTNDVMRFTAPADLARHLRALSLAVRARVGPVPVFINQLPPMWSFPVLAGPLRSWAGLRGHRLDRALRATVRELPDAVLFSGIQSVAPELFAADGFHPSAAGYAFWADRLAEAWADRRILPLPGSHVA